NAPGRASREASDRVRGPKTTRSDPSHTMSIDASGWTLSACDPTVTVSRHVAATHVASSCVAALASYMRLTLVRAARRPIRTSRSVAPRLGSKRSDRHLAASRVALVPAALAWPARLAHRNPASTRRDPLPDLPDHRIVPGRRPDRSLPGCPAHIARAFWRSHRRPRGPPAVAHRHPDWSRGLLGRARDRDTARVRERALPLRVHRHRRGLLGSRRSRPRSAHAEPPAARAAARGNGAEPGPLPDRVHRRSGDGG